MKTPAVTVNALKGMGVKAAAKTASNAFSEYLSPTIVNVSAVMMCDVKKSADEFPHPVPYEIPRRRSQYGKNGAVKGETV